LTFNLIKDFGAALGKEYTRLHVATPMRRYIMRPGRWYLHAGYLIVQLDPFRSNVVLEGKSVCQDSHQERGHLLEE
jgi:hypothetical protein